MGHLENDLIPSKQFKVLTSHQIAKTLKQSKGKKVANTNLRKVLMYVLENIRGQNGKIIVQGRRLMNGRSDFV